MQEKLQKIKARCEELLAIAEHRDSGSWKANGRYIGVPNHMSWIGELRDIDTNWCDDKKSSNNALFIASCAGPAEAGWRTTIATINLIGDYYSDIEMRGYYAPIIKAILAAWPDELL